MSHEHGSQSCREIFARLSEYLDDELDPGFCDRVEGHLEDCPPCQAFLESLRRTVGLVGSLPRAKLDDEARRRVIDDFARLRAELPRDDG
jgi:anti-sigma factor RsiW